MKGSPGTPGFVSRTAETGLNDEMRRQIDLAWTDEDDATEPAGVGHLRRQPETPGANGSPHNARVDPELWIVEPTRSPV